MKDRDYDLDFTAGTRWYDYALTAALIVVTSPVWVPARIYYALKRRGKK